MLLFFDDDAGRHGNGNKKKFLNEAKGVFASNTRPGEVICYGRENLKDK